MCVCLLLGLGAGGKGFMDFFAGETEVCVFYKCKWRVDKLFSPEKNRFRGEIKIDVRPIPFRYHLNR